MAFKPQSWASTTATAADVLHLEGEGPGIDEASSISSEVVLESHVSNDL